MNDEIMNSEKHMNMFLTHCSGFKPEHVKDNTITVQSDFLAVRQMGVGVQMSAHPH